MKRTWLVCVLGALLGHGTLAQAQTMPPELITQPMLLEEGGGAARKGGFQFGAGIYFMKPFWESNTAFSTTTQTITVAPGATTVTTSTSTSDFDHGASFAPRVWAGYVGECGLGIRLGWWRLDDTASARASVTPATPGGPLVAISAPGLPTQTNAGLAAGQIGNFSLNNKIELNVFDLDITQRLLDNACWNLTVGAGVRYMTIDQSYNGARTFTGLPAGVTVIDSVATRNDFDAVGPNLLFDAQRRLGSSGLGLYASGRFGVLFGSSRQESITSNFQAAGAASVTASSTTTANRDDLIPFLDVEAGVQWEGTAGNFRPFARVGVTGQNYFGVGNGSQTTTTTNLGFFGLSATFGVSW